MVIFRNASWAYVGRPPDRRLLTGVDVRIVGNHVAEIGPGLAAPPGTRVVDASNWLVLPGFVNAHHHLTQQFTRAMACDCSLVEWLAELYPVWSAMDEEAAFHGARAGIAELLLTGTTTISDFTYFFPRGQERIFDAQVRAARESGCRFAPVRGGLAEVEAGVRDLLGSSLDAAREDQDTLLSEIERTAAAYHDGAPDSMCRVGAGLTEKTYSDPRLMVAVAELAERRMLRLHTHLHPRPDERAFARQQAGLEPIDFLKESGWWSDRLWIAHGTGLSDDEVSAMSEAGVGLCTCPSSNARFGLPIAPAFDLARRGGRVAIGVDGAASNDSGDMLGEVRLTLQVQRIRAGMARANFREVTPELVLDWATRGGGAVLGWPELGVLEGGGLADLSCFDLSSLEYLGIEDPLAGLLLCGISHRADLVMVNGEIVVEGGRLARVDEEELVAGARRAGADLRRRAACHMRKARTAGEDRQSGP